MCVHPLLDDVIHKSFLGCIYPYPVLVLVYCASRSGIISASPWGSNMYNACTCTAAFNSHAAVHINIVVCIVGVYKHSLIYIQS